MLKYKQMEKVEEKQPAKKRVLYFSVLNVLACFGVVLLHCNGAAFWGFLKSKTWISANIIETLFYFPVPIFFMLSGATLLGYRKRYSTREFLQKRFMKTVLPFLFWSVIAMLYTMAFDGTFDWNPAHIAINILHTRYMSIYWFFIALFAVYLSLPVLSAVEDKLKLQVYKYAIILGMIFVAVLPLAFQLLQLGGPNEYNWELTPPIVGGYILFVLLGYYLSKVELTKKQRFFIYICGVAGAIVQFVGCWVLSFKNGFVDTTFKGYTNLPSVTFAIAVFVWFKYLDYGRILQKFPWFENIVNKLAGLTFGIYLIHGFIVYSLPAMIGFDARNWVWRTLGSIAIFIICGIIVWLLKKIPFIKRIVP